MWHEWSAQKLEGVGHNQKSKCKIEYLNETKIKTSNRDQIKEAFPLVDHKSLLMIPHVQGVW